MRACALLVLVAACGDNVPGGFSPGSRIAPYGDVYEGGVTVPDPTTFRDLERDEDCTLQTWSDGATYCTPQSTELVYADQFCRKLVARSTTGPARYGRVSFVPPTGDSLISRLRVLGDVVPSAAYYRPTYGECVGPQPADPEATFYAVTDLELAATDFARVTRQNDEIDDQLALLRLVTDDGLSLPLGFRDHRYGFDCDPGSPSVCAPRHAVLAHVFTDALCNEPAAYVGEANNVDAIELERDGVVRFFSLTGPQTAPLYAGTSDHCVPSFVGGVVYTAGAELELAAVTRRAVASSTRFSPIALGQQALGVIDRVVRDNLDRFECVARDGLCAPGDNAGVGRQYLDSACTEPFDLTYLPLPASPAYVVDAGNAYAVGPPVEQMFYGPDETGACVPVRAVYDHAVHPVGPALPLGTVSRRLLR
jgi:hypothetical protein